MTQEKRVIPFSQSVKISKHAIDRAVERLNQPQHCAENHIRQLLSAAAFHGEGSNEYGKVDVYLHRKTGVSIIVSQKDSTVVTLYCPDEQPKLSAVSITVDRLATAIKREFKRMQTEALRDIRKMKEEYAAMYVEIAQLKYNKIRCRAPHTQLIIQTKIDELVAKTSELTKVIDAKLTEIERAKSEVKAVAGDN